MAKKPNFIQRRNELLKSKGQSETPGPHGGAGKLISAGMAAGAQAGKKPKKKK